MTLPAFAQNKIDDRLGNSAEVLKQILAKPDEIPQAYLNKAVCVLVFPAVKKVAIGIGGSYGRGVIVCRTGPDMTGHWSSPAMYKLDTGSLGVQLGSSTTDYVLLVETKTGAQKILSGKLKLGADATAVAGPTAQRLSVLTTPTLMSSPTQGQRADCSPALPWLALDSTPMMTPTSLSMAKTSPQLRLFVKAESPQRPQVSLSLPSSPRHRQSGLTKSAAKQLRRRKVSPRHPLRLILI
jgi:hypothetical protein